MSEQHRTARDGAAGSGAARAAGEVAGVAEVDAAALLVALVLVPNSYPRNRFFTLFEKPYARRARRRAALLRSLSEDIRDGVCELTVVRQDEGIWIAYRMPELEARRQTLLDDDELALLQLVVERSGFRCPDLRIDDHDPHAHARIQQRLLALLR